MVIAVRAYASKEATVIKWATTSRKAKLKDCSRVEVTASMGTWN
jgi:hypothetical protein